MRAPPERTPVPCSRSRGPHARHALWHPPRPLRPANPARKLLGGFAGRISPKRHNTPAFPQLGKADIEQTPPETAQKTRAHGEIGPRFLRNRPGAAEAQPRAKPRQPQALSRAQPVTQQDAPAFDDIRSRRLAPTISALLRERERYFKSSFNLSEATNP